MSSTGQIWRFGKEMKIGDWVVLPSKMARTIHVGKITGDYKNMPKAEDPYYHSRMIDWFATEIPRTSFDQDILYSLGSALTICKICRNNAENRIKVMYQNNWIIPQSQGDKIIVDEESDDSLDIEDYAKDAIAKFIERKFKGHELTGLIDAILKAQGYFTLKMKKGPDGGVDIFAGKGNFGFDKPNLCVQVKSGKSIDRPTLDALIGVMDVHKAEYGLLVSWNNFKKTVEQERPRNFFKIRFWGQEEIINELLKSYDSLDEETKAKIPLKKMWSLTIDKE